MDNMFTPTLDWGNELLTSLWWIAKAWVIAAVATMVILWLIHRFTTWGRQFWRITGDYFTGPDSVKVWIWLAVLLLSVVTGVRIDVLLSYQGNDMMTSFQAVAAGLGNGDDAVKNSGKDGFWFSMLVFAILATIHVARVMLDLFLMQRFMLRWRAWLTDRLTGDWLDGKAYYRARFIDDTIDNPDQRIQQDIDIFTAGVGPLPNTPNNTSAATLLFGAISVDHVDDLLHRDPVESLGHTHTAHRRGRASEGDVLDRAGLRARSRPSSRSGSAGRSSGCPSTTRSSTPRSATRWCACAMPRRRSPSTGASWPSARGCGDCSRPSSPTTSGTSTG